MTGKRIRYLRPRNHQQAERRGTIEMAYGAALRVIVKWDDDPKLQLVSTDTVTWHGVEQQETEESCAQGSD